MVIPEEERVFEGRKEHVFGKLGYLRKEDNKAKYLTERYAA